MNTSWIKRLIWLGGLGLCLLASPTLGQVRQMIDLGYPPGTDTFWVTGINNRSQIIGNPNPGNMGRAYLYENGVWTDLGTVETGTWAEAYGINNHGHIVGQAATSGNFHTRAFLYKDKQMTALGTLGGDFSRAYAINDAGQIVGDSTPNDTVTGYNHAFLYSPGSGMTDLGTLGGNDSYARAINNLGQVVGESEITPGGLDHGFLYSGGQIYDLGVLPGGYESYAVGINDQGQILGYGDTYNESENKSEFHGFIYTGIPGAGGVMTDLGPCPLDAYQSSAGVTSINQRGWITGLFTYGGTYPNSIRAFLYAEGVWTDLGNLAPDTGARYARTPYINDRGQIAGSSDTNLFTLNAFLYNSLPLAIVSGYAPLLLLD